MAAVISFLLTNHYLLPALGCFATALIIYMKGRSSGIESTQQKNTEAMDRIQADLQKREAQNQNIETQRDTKIEEVKASSSIQNLIDLWNKLQK